MNLWNKLLHTHNIYALIPLRLAVGAVLIAHGAQKLFGWFGGYGLAGTGGFFQESLGMAPGVFWAFMAGFAEFGGGLMILLGVLTRIGAALNVVTMFMAIWLVHRHAFFLPEGMEFALTLLAASLTLLIGGGGAASVDRMLARKKSTRS